MMYAYERLEKLVNGICNKPERSFEQFFMRDIESFERVFNEELKNVETYLVRQSMCIENVLTFKMLIHQYQAIVISMLDKVFESEKKEDGLYPKPVYQFILTELKKLFTFLFKRFANFFNQDEKTPEIYLFAVKQQIKEKMKLLEKHTAKEISNIEIRQLILQTLKDFLNEDLALKITCRELLYIEKLVAHLLHFKNKDADVFKIEDEAIIKLLVFINFNPAGMSNCIINKIHDKINLIKPLNLQIEELTFYLKMYNQFSEKPETGFKNNSASLKEQITNWIGEEIYFMEKKCKNNFPVPAINEEIKAIDKKLHLSISVDVLTIIARAAKDSKLIVNKQSREMFQNISSYVRTKNAENISVNSMIKKSYVAERNNKESAIDILHDMIKRIHEY